MKVIATAGHVDHGKSTLVKRLTGIDPDRLAEEKARQMTIDLGFAWLTLPDNVQVGVVDVPGHRDFIENMVAGVGGIDAALLVIASDEGVMPQTREHLAILDLLGIDRGIVVLTKCDLVEQDWLEIVIEDLREVLRGSVLAQAPVLPVSALTGEGIPGLLHTLSDLLQHTPPRLDVGQPVLPIDRSFTIAGFGTVVTGTLRGGTLAVGDEIEIQPGALRGRIRGLQQHKQALPRMLPGSRAAVNISGIDWTDLRRGMVLTHPQQVQPTTLIDVFFRYLPDVGRPLKHAADVRFFTGTAQSNARVRLLNVDTLQPGQEGWLQLVLDNPIVAQRGDRFLLRYPSPGQTIGGGVIVESSPARRWRRFQPSVLTSLETRLLGTPAERLAELSQTPEPVKWAMLQQISGFDAAGLDAALQDAQQRGLLVALPDRSFWSAQRVAQVRQTLRTMLEGYHREFPLRQGMPVEELRGKLRLKREVLTALLEQQQDVEQLGGVLKLSDHVVRFTVQQQSLIEQLRSLMQSYTPPSTTEAQQIVGDGLLRALLDVGELVQVQDEVIFSSVVYTELRDSALEIIDQQGEVTVKALRDRFDTSRKYIIALLEHLDAEGYTRRQGEGRVRGRKRP